MTKTKTGVMLVAAAVAGACSGGAADSIGDMMVDAGNMLTDAGETVRDAMGGGDAQAMDEAGSGLDGAQLPNDATTDGASDTGTGTPASQVYTADCDYEVVREVVSGDDPDLTSTTTRYWARFELPELDNPPRSQISVWTCDREYFGTGTDPYAPQPCPDGWTCSDTGETPAETGCAQNLVQRVVGNVAWVNCGYRALATDDAGDVTNDYGNRWNTVRLVVD